MFFDDPVTVTSRLSICVAEPCCVFKPKFTNSPDLSSLSLSPPLSIRKRLAGSCKLSSLPTPVMADRQPLSKYTFLPSASNTCFSVGGSEAPRNRTVVSSALSERTSHSSSPALGRSLFNAVSVATLLLLSSTDANLTPVAASREARVRSMWRAPSSSTSKITFTPAFESSECKFTLRRVTSRAIGWLPGDEPPVTIQNCP